MGDHLTDWKAKKRIAELENELDNERAKGIHSCHQNCQRPMCVLRRDNERLQARVELLEGAARKALTEQAEADDPHHSTACMNWSFLEHSQHQCGLCDLREALAALEDSNVRKGCKRSRKARP